ncbi:hypothetical protein AB0H73_18800 [Streptomyces olivoreticuli]
MSQPHINGKGSEMRIPFVSDALYRRKLRRELINTAHHDYFRMLAENESLRAEVKQSHEQCLATLRDSRAAAIKTQDTIVAASHFADAISDSGRAGDLAPALMCSELDALATLLVATGRSDLARVWLETHFEMDNEEHDTHRVDEHGKPVNLEEYLVDLAA